MHMIIGRTAQNKRFLLAGATATVLALAFLAWQALAENTHWPDVPDFVQNATITGSYVTSSGDILWEKVAPIAGQPGQYEHICGSTFILMGTQANWNGTESQQGSQMTVVDNSGNDSDPRCGYFRIQRNTATDAQEFIYRLWEIQPPNGYTGLNIVNSYQYNTPAQAGVIRTDNLTYYPNSAWQPGQYINGWNFGQIVNYAVPTALTWKKTDALGNPLAGSVWNLTNYAVSGAAIAQVTDCTAGNDGTSTGCSGQIDQDNRAGHFKITSITAEQFGTWNLFETQAPTGYQPMTGSLSASLDLWHLSADFGTIANQPIPPSVPVVSWEKVDSSDNHLGGAVFSLTSTTGGTNYSSIADCVSSPCSGGNGLDSDPRAGYLSVPVAPDTYTLTEVSAPASYVFDPSKTWTITAQTAGTTVSLDEKIVNYSSPALTFTKTDIDTSELLGGATFQITRNGTIVSTVTDCVSSPCATGNWQDIDPTPGRITIENLPAASGTDNYSILETNPPTGYFLNGTALNGTVTNGIMNDLGTITDQHLPQIAWMKIDASLTSVALPGSIWKITDESGEHAIYDCTDSNASCGDSDTPYLDSDPRAGYFRVTVSDASDNTHSLIETSPPTGYNTQNLPHGNITFVSGGCAVGSAATIDPSLTASVGTSTTIAASCLVDLGQIANTSISPVLSWEKTNSINTGEAVQSNPNRGYPIAGAVFEIKKDGAVIGQVADYTGQADYSCKSNGGSGSALCDIDPRAGYFSITDFMSGANGTTADMSTSEVTAPAGYVITTDNSNNFSATCEMGESNCYFSGTGAGYTADGVNTVSGVFGITDRALPYIRFTKVSSVNSAVLGGSAWALTSSTCPTASINLTDNGENDLDPTAGNLFVQVPCDGDWTLTETIAPNGYSPSSAPITIGTTYDNFTPSATDASILEPNPQINNTDATTDHYCSAGSTTCANGLGNDPLPAPIAWRKDDDTGNLLAGSTWKICADNTSSGSPQGCSGTTYEITDCDTAPCPDGLYTDQNPTAGIFSIKVPAQISYDIWESAAPAGFLTVSDDPLLGMKITAPEPETYTWLGEQGNKAYPKVRWQKMSNAGTPSDTSDDFTIGGGTWRLYVDPTANSGYTPEQIDGSAVEVNGITDCIENSASDCTGDDQDPRAGYFEVTLPPCAIAGSNCLGTNQYYKWTVEETAQPTGYLDATKPSELSTDNIGVLRNNSNPALFVNNNYDYGVLLNSPIEPTLSFQKTTPDGTNLGGATFRLETDGGGYLIITDNDGAIDYQTSTGCINLNQTSTITNQVICDEDPRAGYFFTSSLPTIAMHWTVYEEVAPLGYYKIDGAVTDFTSDPLGLVGNIHTVLDPIINQPILGELQWSKIDSKGNLLSGSQWELSSSSAGISRTYTVIDNTGDADYETTSGCIPDIPSDGSIAPASAQILVVCDQDPTPGKFDVTSLAPESSWSIYETLAPSGYQRLSGQAASAIWLSYTNPRGNYNQIVNHLAPTNPGTPGVPNTGSLDTKGSTATPVLGGILFVTLTSLTILGYKITKIRKSKD